MCKYILSYKYMFLFIFMILDIGSFGDIIRTHVLTRLGRKWRHNKIHELMRMAEAMRRKDTLLSICVLLKMLQILCYFKHFNNC